LEAVETAHKRLSAVVGDDKKQAPATDKELKAKK
jgi:hypothetical protein